MIVLIGMAVGVDYSLFYLKREREERERAQRRSTRSRSRRATSGHSIVVSGLAVIASMAGLFVVGGATFNSLATGSILVVAIAVLGSITVLPALLVEARPLGRPAARAAAVAAQPPDRPGGISRRILGPGRAPPGRGAGRCSVAGRRGARASPRWA